MEIEKFTLQNFFSSSSFRCCFPFKGIFLHLLLLRLLMLYSKMHFTEKEKRILEQRLKNFIALPLLLLLHFSAFDSRFEFEVHLEKWPFGLKVSKTWKHFRHHKGQIAYVASALFCSLSPAAAAGRRRPAEVLMMLMWVTKIRNGRTSRRKRIVLLPRSLGVLRPLEAVVVALTAWVQQQQPSLLQAPTTQLAYCKAEAEAGSGRTSRGASLTKPCWSRRRRRRRRSWTATAPVTSRSAWWGEHIINHDYFSIAAAASSKLELNQLSSPDWFSNKE